MRSFAIFWAFVFSTLPGWADEASSAPDCSIYRRGPLQTKEIAIYSLPDVYEMTEVYYRPEYDFGGMEGGPDGRPNDTLLVDINIADGQPLPRRIRNSTPPQEQTFFTMLLKGWPFLNTGRTMSIYSGSQSASNDFGELIDGKFYYDTVPFVRTGKDFFGFEYILVDDADEYSRRRFDNYIREDTNGEITSYLRCARIGSVPVPHCSLFEKTDNFELKFRFRRNQMHLVETIRRRAHDFANCLTIPAEGEK